MKVLTPDGDTVAAYLALDDSIVWNAIERLCHCSDERVVEIANRIRARKRPLSIDIQTEFPNDLERQRRAKHKLNKEFEDSLDVTVFCDDAKLTLYGEIGADDAQAQKRLMIQLPGGDPREITNFHDSMIMGSERTRQFLRYYFLSESDHKKACKAVDTIKRGT